MCVFFFLHTSTFQLLDKPWSQVSSRLPPGSCLQFLSRIGFSNPTARRFFIECCSTHALAFPASQFEHKKKSPRIYTSMHLGGFELTKLTCTRLEDILIRHRGDIYTCVFFTLKRSFCPTTSVRPVFVPILHPRYTNYVLTDCETREYTKQSQSLEVKQVKCKRAGYENSQQQ